MIVEPIFPFCLTRVMSPRRVFPFVAPGQFQCGRLCFFFPNAFPRHLPQPTGSSGPHKFYGIPPFSQSKLIIILKIIDFASISSFELCSRDGLSCCNEQSKLTAAPVTCHTNAIQLTSSELMIVDVTIFDRLDVSLAVWPRCFGLNRVNLADSLGP